MESFTVVGWLIRGAIAVAVLVGCYLIIRRLRSGAGKGTVWSTLAVSLRGRIVPFVVFTGAVAAVSTLAPISTLEEAAAALALSAMGGAWIVVAAWGLTLLLLGMGSLVDMKYDVTVEDNLGARQVQTKIKVLQRIIIVVIWLGALAGVLMQFERFRMLGGTMLASAGVASIVLGLSAQKTFGSIIAGIQIALSHPINLDDVVIVEGEWGRIEEITFTYVVVKVWDLRRLVVPITYFLENPFQNWTKKSAEIIGSVFLHVDYTMPLAPLRRELERLCGEAGAIWNGKTCVLQVTEAGPQTMTVRALVSSPDASKAWDLRCRVREGLIEFMQANYPECLPRRRVVVDDPPAGRGIGEGAAAELTPEEA
jgi:small-conductance mechanosensitive channel